MREINKSQHSLPIIVAVVLVLGGMALVLGGSLMASPHLSSRLATFRIDRQEPDQQIAWVSPSPAATPSPPISTVPRVSLLPQPSATVQQEASAIPEPPTSLPTPTSTSTPVPRPPTRLLIDAIGVDGPVVPVAWETREVEGTLQSTWIVPDRYAAGWHETSAALGVGSNTVLNGHNTGNGEIFRDAPLLKAGDLITVYANTVPFTFVVSDTLILPEAGQPLDVRLSHGRYILPTEEERLTIVTCHPYNSLRSRLIVIATRRPLPAATPDDPAARVERHETEGDVP